MVRSTLLAALALAAVPIAGPVAADGNLGPYLAGRVALAENDFAAATSWLGRALRHDPDNLQIMESAATAALAAGDVDRAAEWARGLVENGVESQVAGLILFGEHAAKDEWQAVLDDLDAGRTVGPLFDGLIGAWAEVGLGSMSDALGSFDKVSETSGVQAFGLYHKALALAISGDYEGAERILSGEDGTIRLDRRGIIARAEILSQLERNEEAVKLIDDTFGSQLDPGLEQIRARLAAGETLPFDVVRNAKDGVAEVYLSIAGALSGEAADGYTLLYARMAGYLRPDNIGALLMSAGLLENLGRYELANQVYSEVPADDPAFIAAEIGRAEALRQAGNTDAAIEVLEQLARTHPDQPVVQVTLGDALRQLERYADAARAYDRAIALHDGPPEASQWVVYFARGIARERTEDWAGAEADFREALELRPDQPQVLNYLGYSMVEKKENLDEALGMIERAVAAEPDAGYIVDSLGWALYRLDRYEEAVPHLERAAELMPVDPVVNDHLGDAYWAVGRKLEARFQWRRALSFDPEPDEAERIRRKLEVGLDQVLADEGAPPISVAHDG